MIENGTDILDIRARRPHVCANICAAAAAAAAAR